MLRNKSDGLHSLHAEPLNQADVEELRLRTRQVLLALGMLISGTANTLTCKAALTSMSMGKEFQHPFVMAGCMFSGEIICLVAYRVGACCRSQARVDRIAARVPKHIFALPAICDIAGTSVMYVGLTLTTASTYQMLRGSVILFTGVLSATYLKRRQWAFHWSDELHCTAVDCCKDHDACLRYNVHR